MINQHIYTSQLINSNILIRKLSQDQKKEKKSFYFYIFLNEKEPNQLLPLNFRKIVFAFNDRLNFMLTFLLHILTLSAMAGFQTHISNCFERGVELNFFIFFFIGASATKRFARFANRGQIRNYRASIPRL